MLLGQSSSGTVSGRVVDTSGGAVARRLLPNPVVKALFDGWQVSDITTLKSGARQGISFSESPSVNFLGGGDAARTLMVANPNLPSGQRTFNEFFNTAAFAEPIPMSPSSCTVNGCPAPTIANLPLAIRGICSSRCA